jgi:hypothetical protein
MWIPCVVFAHVFAGYFMARMLVVMFPKAWADFKRKICCGASSSSAQQKHAPKPGEESMCDMNVFCSLAGKKRLQEGQQKGSLHAGTQAEVSGGQAVWQQQQR